MDKALALIVMLVVATGTLGWYYGATKEVAILNAEELARAPHKKNPLPALSSVIPAKRFGVWLIQIGPDHWFPQFCPRRSTIFTTRLDPDVGVTMWATNLEGEKKTFYIPPGPEILEIKDGTADFIPYCLTYKADRPVKMLVDIRRR